MKAAVNLNALALESKGGRVEVETSPARSFASAQETVAKDGTPFLGIFLFSSTRGAR